MLLLVFDVELSKRGRVEKAGLWGDWSGEAWVGVVGEGLGRGGGVEGEGLGRGGGVEAGLRLWTADGGGAE